MSIGGTKIIIMFITQGKSNMSPYGSQYATFGGSALKFWVSIRLKLQKIDILLDNRKIARGIKIKIVVEKNKVSRPFRQVELWLSFDGGIDEVYTAISYLRSESTILGSSGGWYNWGDRKFHGELEIYNFMCAPENDAEWEQMLALAVDHFNSTR